MLTVMTCERNCCAVADFLAILTSFLIILIPIGLTVWNIVTLILFLTRRTDSLRRKIIESIAIALGVLFLYLLVFEVSDIVPVDWNEVIYEIQMHSPLSLSRAPTVLVLSVLGLVGYAVLRWVPFSKQPPLLTAGSIAGMYIGGTMCVLWCVQCVSAFDRPLSDFFPLYLALFPMNLILLYIKTIAITVFEKDAALLRGDMGTKYARMKGLFADDANLPLAGLILMIPLLGLTVLFLTLFGQEPDSVIKAWTETADWTMSRKIAPPSIPYDGHYLCTVAATGHKKVVKPLRTGIRHGHTVMVNRQLCIANAFEDIIHEKTPRFHRAVRSFYDKTGLPISHYIKTKTAADIVYFLMKPLEWLFLLVIYAVDVKPENRIAVQYPHSAPPAR